MASAYAEQVDWTPTPTIQISYQVLERIIGEHFGIDYSFGEWAEASEGASYAYMNVGTQFPVDQETVQYISEEQESDPALILAALVYDGIIPAGNYLINYW